jgi:hypothetical protein
MSNTGLVFTNFKGTKNDTIKGSSNGTNYRFYNLNVDKGTDATPILSLKSNITTGFTNPFLNLNNGTFRVDTSILNLPISTSSVFKIPSTACFSVKSGTATIGFNNVGDVQLSGKLEVLGGTLNIGNTTTNGNDIEYTPAGNPLILVNGGTLNVAGQIRRNTSNGSGALNYTQNGGSVFIKGQVNDDSRAKLEILNIGSQFNMYGGSITLLSAGGGTTFGDLYLRPSTYNVTGGFINIGDASSTANQNFKIISEIPLWDLCIGNTSSSQTATLTTIPLTVLNHLNIKGNSVFNAGGFDVNLGDSLTNANADANTGISTGGYQPGTISQVTTFNGTSNQFITGNGANLTNFANVVVNTGGTLSLGSNSNIRINNDLTINSGQTSDGNNTIYLVGNVENNATHLSGSTGKIEFCGPLKQVISGSGLGVFGNLVLNNSVGVDMIDNSTVNGKLTFTRGSLYR